MPALLKVIQSQWHLFKYNTQQNTYFPDDRFAILVIVLFLLLFFKWKATWFVPMFQDLRRKHISHIHCTEKTAIGICFEDGHLPVRFSSHHCSTFFFPSWKMWHHNFHVTEKLLYILCEIQSMTLTKLSYNSANKYRT